MGNHFSIKNIRLITNWLRMLTHVSNKQQADFGINSKPIVGNYVGLSKLIFANRTFEGGILSMFIFKILSSQINDLALAQFILATISKSSTSILYLPRYDFKQSLSFDGFLLPKKISLVNEHPSYGYDNQTNEGSCL